MAALLTAVLWYILTLAPADFEAASSPLDQCLDGAVPPTTLSPNASFSLRSRLNVVRLLRTLISGQANGQLLWLPRAIQPLLRRLVTEASPKEVQQAVHEVVQMAYGRDMPIQAKL
jgi:hypothetical protein